MCLRFILVISNSCCIKIEIEMTAKNQMIHDNKDTSVHSRLAKNYKVSSRKYIEEQSKFIGKKEKDY
eukprot:TRINITY_DN3269_c1_g1_i1.p1 TRINITY_DN3269_c1_g1~~TRINITY_DN3269_c1_g1_i1.p1  ORF type:complete len:67 (-),score=15.15 TRINITY_DN3269_c1_g1_i1:55-255(-)